MPRGPFRDPLPSHLSPSGATEPLRSHSQSKVRTATPRRPGLLLGAAALAPFRFGAARLYDKAGQVWLFTRQFKVPWASNASEQALKDRNDIGPSPGTGTPPSPSPATA